jgi:hypothetical protein
VESVAGERFCNFVDFSGRIYLTGAVVWSSYIGLYRVLFIKAQVFCP